MTRIDARSRLFAVLGDPVAHSLSPAMHNAAFTVLGLNAVYVALRVSPDQLPEVLRALRHVGVAGNLTIPLKVDALPLVDELTETARRAGAMNTFWTDGGRLLGDNTDVAGAAETLRGLDAESPWLLLGTGGSARAVAVAAADAGADLVVRSRDAARAESFAAWARALGGRVVADDGRPVRTAINTTPLGLNAGDALPVPHERLDGTTTALDLVYARGETPWIRACRAAGLRAADGRTVLVSQGVRALERFAPGSVAPRAVMAAAVARALEA